MKTCIFNFFILMFLMAVAAQGATATVAQPYGMIPGYTDDPDSEVPSEPKEMILMEKPAFLNKPALHKVIFNDQLTDEFLFRYQQTFGMTELEENYFLISRQGYYMSPTGLTATQQDGQRREFAEYMVK